MQVSYMKLLAFQVFIKRVYGNRHASYNLKIVWEDGFIHDEDVLIMPEFMPIKERILWDTVHYHLKSRENVIGQN